MKVLIGIPALDHCATDVAMSLAALLMKHAYDKRLKREVKLALMCAKSTIIPHARNLLVDAAIEASATHVFMLDSDMCVPPHTLDQLLNHHVPIVGADYVKRVPPHPLCGNPMDLSPPKPSGLKEMRSMPFGCILINMKVFATMERPYFSYREGATEADTLSEDTYWSNMARQAGHTIWCDIPLSKEVGHVGTKVFRPT